MPSESLRPFGARLLEAFASTGHVCVGIDPHAWLLDRWGLADTASGAEAFGLAVVEAAISRVGIVKPQVAFFERHGADGYRALETVIAAARAAGLIIIADAKRGDVGSTVEAYGEAWLRPGSPLEADAMTAVAYQGLGSLAPVEALARANGKGIFVLAATSNPEAARIQSALDDRGASIAASIVGDVHGLNRGEPLGSTGVVIGATVAVADFGIDVDLLAGTPILAPGFGHQGARIDEVRALFGPAADSVIVAASRSVLDGGPSGLRSAIDAHVLEADRAFAR